MVFWAIAERSGRKGQVHVFLSIQLDNLRLERCTVAKQNHVGRHGVGRERTCKHSILARLIEECGTGNVHYCPCHHTMHHHGHRCFRHLLYIAQNKKYRCRIVHPPTRRVELKLRPHIPSVAPLFILRLGLSESQNLQLHTAFIDYYRFLK